MTEQPKYMIIDDTGVLWSSDAYDAHEEGSAILGAVDAGTPDGYREALGEAWKGDLVLVQELYRTR